MIVSIRVAPSVDGKLTEGSAETQLRELRDARVFEIVEGDRSRPRNLVKLVPRIPRGKIMKLGNGGTP